MNTKYTNKYAQVLTMIAFLLKLWLNIIGTKLVVFFTLNYFIATFYWVE